MNILNELQPDGYLVLGDTNSCLSAISAKRLHIPLFHMEAGNRCKVNVFQKKQTEESLMSSVMSIYAIANSLESI